MAEAHVPMEIDMFDGIKSKIDGADLKKMPLKRKRLDPNLIPATPEEKQQKIDELYNEVNSLVKLFKQLVSMNGGPVSQNAGEIGSTPSLNILVACLMEDSDLPLSKLVDEIIEKVKVMFGDGGSISKAIVKSTVLLIGQRLCYGETNADADVLEDAAESALWCWETRDVKLIPKVARVSMKVRRTCRKKIHERITAIHAMIRALGNPEAHHNHLQLTKASEKLGKVLNDADIRLLVQNMSQTNDTEIAVKQAEKEGKLLIKQIEKNKREMEREKKKRDRELYKEKLQSEKESKRLHDEAEKEERRREKEEHEMQKQMKKQQEEAEKDQIRREKEEAENKKRAEKDQMRKEKEEAEQKRRAVLHKQASLMERFLKRNSTSQHDSSMDNASVSDSSSTTVESKFELVTQAMDSVFAQNGGVEAEAIWKSHLNSWRAVGRSCLNRKVHWGCRQKPKSELVKEIKLTTYRETSVDEDLFTDKLVDENVDSGRLHPQPLLDGEKRIRSRQLLQFDKSHRPAFYGVWSRKSPVVGPRHPYAKDPDVDYEIDSDEEWEEDEPGESLSDCDKDDESECLEGNLKGDDEDESEDDFFVPDGYLSENEGLQNDEMECDDLVEEIRCPPNSEELVQSEEFCELLRQQKYLNKMTDHALKKNQPLVILNLMHEKTISLSPDELTGIDKVERMCLQTLCMLPLPGFSSIEVSIDDNEVDESLTGPNNKSSPTSLPMNGTSVLDSDLPQIISIIKSRSQSINKIVEHLHNNFPDASKSQLRNKVREVSEFNDNRWQVKKEVLSKLGLSISPEKNNGKPKTITTFFSKRCLPPPTENMNLSPDKPSAVIQLQENPACE